MPERRSSPRTRTFKSGKIYLNGKASVIDCTVRNLSATGAKLTVVTTLGIPASFLLGIGEDGDERPCRVVRRTATEIGVSFLKAAAG